jgi:osmoprotectant transport system substrate-binding protein
MRKTLLAAVGLLCVSVLLTSCALTRSGPYDSGPAKDGPLTGVNVNVASKSFTEQLILCEITAQRLAGQGATVDRTCGMSGSNAVRSALIGGAVDMYWEYTGTGWLALQQTATNTDPVALYEQLRAKDMADNDIVWLKPAEANNTYAVATTAATGKKLGVRTLSDYAKLVSTDPRAASFCGAAEFLGRDDGWPGVEKAYGFHLPDVAQLAEGPIYNAVAQGNPCNFGEVFATDGRIAALGLTLLDDDKRFFLPYNLALVVRGPVLADHPQIQVAMDPVRALLTTAALQKLNAKVDVDGEDPQVVAAKWLKEHDLK